ncbi:MAG: hypothetical protein ACJ8G5_02690 [Burkholderiales bacterium]
MVHRRAYPQQYSIAEAALSERQLDALAHVISTLAPIYTVNFRSARFRQLDPTAMEGGMFRGGARELAFGDERTSIGYLAARVESVLVVARKLREITPERGDDALIRTDRLPPTPTR